MEMLESVRERVHRAMCEVEDAIATIEDFMPPDPETVRAERGLRQVEAKLRDWLSEYQ